MGNFLQDRLALNNENAPGFQSEPIRSTSTVAIPLSLQAPSPALRATRIRSRCVARSFRLSTRFHRSSFQVVSQHQNTLICHACMISQSIIKRTMIRLPAAALSRNNPFFHSVRIDSRIQTLVLPNRKYFIVLLPARFFLPMPPPKILRSGRTQPSKRDRLGFPANLRGARARCTRRQKGADCGPPPEEHPRDEHAEFGVPAP